MLKTKLANKDFPDCWNEARRTGETIITQEHHIFCKECSLARVRLYHASFTKALKHKDKFYGMLSVSLPRELANDNSELSLFKEVAHDISYALHKIELANENEKAQKAVLESERKYRITLQSLGEAVITTDTIGNINLFNNAAEKLTGWQADEVIGKKFEELIHILDEERQAEVEEPVNSVLERGISITGKMNHCLIAKDGNKVAVSCNIAPIRDTDGEISGTIIVFRDITKEKIMQEIISRAERLETAGKLSGQIAHDFNNLLGPLIAYPQLIKDQIDDNKLINDYLSKMENAAKKIADINQQLLTLGRRGHYTLETMNLNNVINQVLSDLPKFSESIAIDTNLQDDLYMIKGGMSQIYRLLSNLVNNALDAINTGGLLTLRTENYYADKVCDLYNRVPRGEYVKLTITDTGKGIPSQIKHRIFEPFFSTKKSDSTRGSGLGLSIVLAVTEDHRGFIDLRSIDGEGTSFYVYFPCCRDLPDAKKEKSVLKGSGQRILVVDDDPCQREVCKALLKKLNYSVETAESGEQAISKIKKSSYDLMLLDMVMPNGIDGAETYKRALKINRDQKALIVSGFAESKRVEKALALGANSYVRKPVDIKSLSSAVARAFQKEPTRKLYDCNMVT